MCSFPSLYLPPPKLTGLFNFTEELSEATAPPMKTIKVGTGDHEFALGGETVLFRHGVDDVRQAGPCFVLAGVPIVDEKDAFHKDPPCRSCRKYSKTLKFMKVS